MPSKMLCPFCGNRESKLSLEGEFVVTLADCRDDEYSEFAMDMEGQKLQAYRCEYCGGQFFI